ncbi:hypothetical protein HMPREF1870_01641 [Bacteroidales bacterium KA00344]|nr:hypothetical protein HMPREF1870_01641 [Bacteroidales bacterium KA00344]
MINPRKMQWVELEYLDAPTSKFADMSFFQRTVITGVAKSIVKGAHLDTLFGLFGQNIKEKSGYGVVAKIEIFKMNGRFRLPDGGKHIVELFLPIHKQRHTVVVSECHATILKMVYEERVARLGSDLKIKK